MINSPMSSSWYVLCPLPLYFLFHGRVFDVSRVSDHLFRIFVVNDISHHLRTLSLQYLRVTSQTQVDNHLPRRQSLPKGLPYSVVDPDLNTKSVNLFSSFLNRPCVVFYTFQFFTVPRVTVKLFRPRFSSIPSYHPLLQPYAPFVGHKMLSRKLKMGYLVPLVYFLNFCLHRTSLYVKSYEWDSLSFVISLNFT